MRYGAWHTIDINMVCDPCEFAFSSINDLEGIMNYPDWAKKALLHVTSLNIQSNNFNTGEICENTLNEMGVFINTQYGAILGDLIVKCGDQQGLGTVVVPAIIGKKFSWGNCESKAALAFIYLGKNGVKPIEMMSVGDDHIVVVLGRDQKSKIANVRDWGDSAVICDPWAGETYGAQLLPTKATQPPLLEVVGATLTISQTFEFIGPLWPPKELVKALQEYKYLL